MSKETVASLSAKIDALVGVVETLAKSQTEAITLPSEAPASPATPVANENFKAKFAFQHKRAKALAKKGGQSVQMWAVPKGREYQVWYFATKRKLAAGSVKLCTINPDGTQHNDIDLSTIKVA